MPAALVTTEPGINSYGTLTGAATHHDNSARGSAWVFLSPDDQARALLSAFDMIERRAFQGTKTGGASQEAQFPRTGLTDINGDTVDSAAVPSELAEAQYELALDIAADSGVITKLTTGSNIKRVKGGSAEVEFLGGKATTKGTRFPGLVEEILRPYLEGSSGVTPPCVGAPTVAPTSSFDSPSELIRGY